VQVTVVYKFAADPVIVNPLNSIVAIPEEFAKKS
jgi:hypothetical protein